MRVMLCYLFVIMKRDAIPQHTIFDEIGVYDRDYPTNQRMIPWADIQSFRMQYCLSKDGRRIYLPQTGGNHYSLLRRSVMDYWHWQCPSAYRLYMRSGFWMMFRIHLIWLPLLLLFFLVYKVDGVRIANGDSWPDIVPMLFEVWPNLLKLFCLAYGSGIFFLFANWVSISKQRSRIKGYESTQGSSNC